MVAVFFISHVVGVNIADPILSKNVLMFNLVLFVIGAFNIHSIFALIKKDKENRGIIFFFYATGIFFILFFVLFPDFFLHPSEPKMYFPNYYVAGSLNWIRVAFLYFIEGVYIQYLLIKESRATQDLILKKQYLYLALALLIAYVMGMVPNFLVYDIYINPLWGMFFPAIFSVPLIYASVRYGLLNVKVIAKQAFAYGVGMALVGGVITLLNSTNSFISATYPNYPLWVNTLISSALAVTISLVVWKHLREIDLLKYEFITTVTHKFRTPLTGIKWATENLKTSTLSEDQKTQVEYIRNANQKLVELTDLLVTTSEAEHASYEYHSTPQDISQLSEEILSSLLHQIQTRKVTITTNFTPHLVGSFDVIRMKFVLQTLIENAIHYSEGRGTITITTKEDGKNIVFSVQDAGIGMNKEELTRIFSKFYRTSRARAADTEGLGIGLFIAREIILHHKGRIWAESEGQGKGSLFTFTIPRF